MAQSIDSFLHRDLRATAVSARCVFVDDWEPIDGGVIEIDREGRIADRHDRTHEAEYDLGSVALLPGLVNAHTHLEFSDIREPIAPGPPFPDWIRRLVQWRREHGWAKGDALHAGWNESACCGTTLLGEISTGGDVTPHDPMGAVIFREVIGFLPEQKDAALQAARQFLDDEIAEPGATTISRKGLSPHAPYSVHPELFNALVDLAAEHAAPVAVHLAETREELQFLRDADGPLADLLRHFGVFRDDAFNGGLRPLAYLEKLAKLEKVLVVHGNYLGPEEIDFLATRPQFSVVYCPRTHRFFEHESHPWRELLERGINVALGTDGRGSNPDLSIWNEMLLLRSRHPELEAATLADLVTRGGAVALGCDDQQGRLSVGKRACWTEVALDDACDAKVTLDSVISAGRRVTGSAVDGFRIASLFGGVDG
ncbi:amidohydrolase family protein [Stratiformator vulcanicus]|uniref:Aminodeoxyfutalosine deaminase n=1 Tax=Stratiformator vulcanicus TaxID=2527980 RepID=A0A517R6M9_9PLAN|nr:amidohydrolase family protein [Stratiformator vulcanicus]QDT39556.1 Aminodeoxyfutalosine deaminase [Stratiformator vulcanicus]